MNNYPKMKIDIFSNKLLNKDKTFDLEKALFFCNEIYGYTKGIDNLQNQSKETIQNIINDSMKEVNHSIYDHVLVNLNIESIPEILVMLLRSEKSCMITEKQTVYFSNDKEEKLYKKWTNYFGQLIKESYPSVKEDKLISLLNENNQYLLSVFKPTSIIYSTTLKQINYLVSWLKKFIVENKQNIVNSFDVNPNLDIIQKLIPNIEEFISLLAEKNVLDERLQRNEKGRTISFFSPSMCKRETYNNSYHSNYLGSFYQVLAAQKIEDANYQIRLQSSIVKDYYLPPIIQFKPFYYGQWIRDLKTISNNYPKGELVNISETGSFENFINKTSKIIGSDSHLELYRRTRQTLLEYQRCLHNQDDDYLSNEINNHIQKLKDISMQNTNSLDYEILKERTLVRRI